VHWFIYLVLSGSFVLGKDRRISRSWKRTVWFSALSVLRSAWSDPVKYPSSILLHILCFFVLAQRRVPVGTLIYCIFCSFHRRHEGAKFWCGVSVMFNLNLQKCLLFCLSGPFRMGAKAPNRTTRCLFSTGGLNTWALRAALRYGVLQACMSFSACCLLSLRVLSPAVFSVLTDEPLVVPSDAWSKLTCYACCFDAFADRIDEP